MDECTDASTDAFQVKRITPLVEHAPTRCDAKLTSAATDRSEPFLEDKPNKCMRALLDVVACALTHTVKKPRVSWALLLVHRSWVS
jgi:hypothetical protein